MEKAIDVLVKDLSFVQPDIEAPLVAPAPAPALGIRKMSQAEMQREARLNAL